MSVVEVNRNPSGRQLRQFGVIWLGFLGLFGLLAHLKSGGWTATAVLWGLAIVVPVAGWLHQPFMRVVFLGMSYLAWPIGFVVSHVVLAVVYYLVLTPVGLVMRVIGHDPMRRRSDPSSTSYWIEREPGGSPDSRYFRQF